MRVLRLPYLAVGSLFVLMLSVAGCAEIAPASEPEAVATAGPTAALAETPAAEPTLAAATETATEPAATAAATEEPAATAAATGDSSDADATPAAGATSESGSAEGINEVTFQASEFRFEAPDTVPAGWTRFTLENVGERPHDLMLLKPEAGKTISDVLEALEAEGPPDWAALYGGVSAGPGETRAYTVNLDPGSYIALSFGQNESGPPDAAQGMIHAFTVSGEASELSPERLPEADATVNMIDFAFVITGALSSGEQTIRVMNTGDALHEMQVFRLDEGVTFEQFTEMLDQEPQEGEEPPFTYVGGPVMSPGVDGFVTMELEAGTHVLVCFIPSPEHGGQPHYKLGMIAQVEVE